MLPVFINNLLDTETVNAYTWVAGTVCTVRLLNSFFILCVHESNLVHHQPHLSHVWKYDVRDKLWVILGYPIIRLVWRWIDCIQLFWLIPCILEKGIGLLPMHHHLRSVYNVTFVMWSYMITITGFLWNVLGWHEVFFSHRVQCCKNLYLYSLMFTSELFEIIIDFINSI